MANTIEANILSTFNSVEFASFGAVHLKNTNLQKSIAFWTTQIGLQLRYETNNIAELGTEARTLVVIHQMADKKFQNGFSGLYHFAIHAPNKNEFAKMLYRLIANNYHFTPIDHTMSKSIYLYDPDGINIEITLETPERFKKLVTENGLKIEDNQGNINAASTPLDVRNVLIDLIDKNLQKPIPIDSKIGHIHFYAKNVDQLDSFYKQIGFEQFNNLPDFFYADLGTGGKYKHRIAMNAWHGKNKPFAPAENAGMNYYEIKYHSKERFQQAINNLTKYDKTENGIFTYDPSSNLVLLKHEN